MPLAFRFAFTATITPTVLNNTTCSRSDVRDSQVEFILKGIEDDGEQFFYAF